MAGNCSIACPSSLGFSFRSISQVKLSWVTPNLQSLSSAGAEARVADIRRITMRLEPSWMVRNTSILDSQA